MSKNDTRIFLEGQPVAEVHRDFRGEKIEGVMLYANAPEAMKMAVLRSLVLYTHQYVGRLSKEEIDVLDRLDLEKELVRLEIKVTEALYPSAKDAIDAAVSQVGIPGLKYDIVKKGRIFEERIRLKFHVKRPNRFIFWHAADVPRPGRFFDLHVVPSYHPVMNGWQEVGMVNGATDAYISGKAVRSVFCPRASRVETGHRFLSSGWNYVKHPYQVTGQWMQLEVDTTMLRSEEGVAELVKVLRGSLGINKTYVAISGGFYPPIKSAHNRLVELRRPSPWPEAHKPRAQHLARGSEAHCVWTYRTLKEERKLNESYVPGWFKQEGWLGIYEGAEVRHGIY
jgi:hypothetical protein